MTQPLDENNPPVRFRSNQIMGWLLSAMLALAAYIGHGVVSETKGHSERLARAESQILMIRERQEDSKNRLERIESKLDQIVDRMYSTPRETRQ